MSVLGRLKNLAVNDEKAWSPSLWRLFGSQSISGEVVNEETALTYSAVWAAVNIISKTVSTLPLHLLRKDNRKTIQATEKSLFRVLHAQANPYMTAQGYRETIQAHLLTWGNGFSEIQRDNYGNVIALWPIPPNRVKMEKLDGAIVYRIRVDKEEIITPRESILHIPGLGFDGFRGYSVIAMANRSIGLSMAMETFGSLYFANGTHPGVVVSHPHTLSETSHKNLEASLSAGASGLGKSHKLLLLEEAMKIEKIGFAPEESQFLQSRQFQIPEVARWFGLPPHKLADLTKSSFSNIESEQSSYATDCILPWLVRLEQNYDMQLLTEREKSQERLYTRHNMDGLLRANSVDRANYYKTMWGTGAMTLNEIREKENWDPISEPYADELFVPANNMVPLSKIDEVLAREGSKRTEVIPDENAQ